MRKLDIDLNENLFREFFTSRYSMTSKIDVSSAWNYAKENNLSFFMILKNGILMLKILMIGFFLKKKKDLTFL